MRPRKLSGGFAGSSTRAMTDFDREVEMRMRKRLDVFTNEFDGPGSPVEVAPGADVSKGHGEYQKPHDDFPARGGRKLHSAGDPKDQEKLDWLDEQTHKVQAPIKNPYDQFPGSYMEVSDMEGEVGPEEFNKKVEARMKRLLEKEERQGWAQIKDQSPKQVSQADAPGNTEKKGTLYKDCEIREYCEDAAGKVMKFRVYREGQKILDRVESSAECKELIDRMLKKMSAEKKKSLAGPVEDNAKVSPAATDPMVSETRKAMGVVDAPSDADKREEAMMKKHLENVDEAKWQKAKDASQEAFGKVKWPFVQWWYKEHGGK